MFAATACGGNTRQDATPPNGGKSGSDGRAGANQTTAGTHSAGEANGAGGFGVAGSPTDLGGAGSNAVAGSSGSPAGQAGVGGTGGFGGTEGCIDCGSRLIGGPSDFGNSGWKSSWFVTGCKARDGASCATVVGTCPTSAASFDQQGARTVEKFPIQGVPAQNYKVTFTFNALVEAKEYTGGTRDAGNDIPASADDVIGDTFYRDGAPTMSGHNVWRLSIYDDKNQLARNYYMNSFPPGQGGESQRLFQVSYTKSIVIVGGGHIEHFVQDPDCWSVDNCSSGTVPSDACPAPRTLRGGDATLLLPPKYKDPSDGTIKPTPELNLLSQGLSQPWHSQLGHLAVIKLEATTDSVLTNYP